MCGRDEWVKFQTALGENYKLHVISRDYFNSVIYEGPYNCEKKVYIYHAENHYSVITSMPAFVERVYYCHNCHVGYNNPGGHICKEGCKCCHAPTKCIFDKWLPCRLCRRYFVSEGCYHRHLAAGICGRVQACADCGKVYHTYYKHVCGMNYCKVCRSDQPIEHLCYIQPLRQRGDEEEDDQPEKKKKKMKTQVYIFYDFECMLVDRQHQPNLCVIDKVCAACIDAPMTETCPLCKREQVILRGDNTSQLVGEWLLSGKNRGAVCIAHNSQGYDALLILEYVHENGIKPEIIPNGQKILSMQVMGMQFTDSLNYFNTALSKLPAVFGINELHKGFFPHLFSTPENQQYVGPIPDAKFYDPEGMQPDKRREFLEWYEQQTHLDYQADLLKYCVSDVDILRRCCGRFRSLFMEHTNIDPFHKCFTIASACNRVYRTHFLQPNQIGIIPPEGYATDNQSTVALCWLDWVAKQRGHGIRHAFNGGEQRIEGMKVDGVGEDGTVYEFHGCFYHGHEDCYPHPTINPVNGISMEELREKTRIKTDKLREKGHDVVEKWECEFKKDIKEDDELKQFFKAYEPYTPIKPRDAFFGGRTNAIILYVEHHDMRYVDFTSLYPWVCKYGLFPIGHPTVYYRDDIPDTVQGLLKCTILPPRNLYHPLLPLRIKGKLMFVLCRTCAEEGEQGKCHHNEDERALTDTWVTLELEKAEELGYVIIKKYAALHFEETTQYKDGRGGLWAECMDLWLQLKQEASGYPSWCESDLDKNRYIEEYKRHEGIQLEKVKIVRNEGLRTLCKMMLNSHWGKFGQNPDKHKVTYVADPEEYIKMMYDDKIEISDLMYANKEHIAIRWRLKADFLEALPNTNVILAAYTTAQARLKLYSLLEGLQERVVYFDTDSVVYIHDEDQWNPRLGDYLGELKDETNGVPLIQFVSGGPKNYGYELRDGKQECKIRGFTPNYRTSMDLNFESMKELVTTPAKRNDKIAIVEPNKIVRRDVHIYSENHTKQYRMVYDKRKLLPNLHTLPFGYEE